MSSLTIVQPNNAILRHRVYHLCLRLCSLLKLTMPTFDKYPLLSGFHARLQLPQVERRELQIMDHPFKNITCQTS